MNPYIVEESQARYQARVDAAEAWRLEQTTRAATAGRFGRVGLVIGACLLAWGRRIQAQRASFEANQ